MKFVEETSGVALEMHRYYGFAEGGGLVGGSAGYDTKEAALQAMMLENGDDARLEDFSFQPDDLGVVSVVILSGQKFVNYIKTLDDGDLSIYGYFTE